MTVAIGADHRGYQLKNDIKCLLRAKHVRVLDCGTDSTEPVDYPVIAVAVAEAVRHRNARFGILLCHTGNGMAIAANKVPGIRAALVFDPVFAGLARRHNDANILVIPAGFVTPRRVIRAIIGAFLTTSFEGGRHRRRVNLIRRYEKTHAL